MLKSRPDRYGSVAVSLHWLGAVAILAMLVTGFRAAGATDAIVQAGFLRFHVPLGLTILALTVLRLVWWLVFDREPAAIDGTPAWQDRLARLAHGALYLVLLGMLGSGMALMALSGAGEVVFGGAGTLPDFSDFAPRIPHGLGAMLLIALILLHVGAALYHHAFRRDGIFRRMWYGGGDAAPNGRD